MNFLMILFLSLFLVQCWPRTGIDPQISEVKKSRASIKENGDFFRYVLFNSESDACILLERINLRDKKPQVKTSQRVCKLRYHDQDYSLEKDKIQDFSIEKIAWNEFQLELSAIFVPTGTAAPAISLQCHLDAKMESPYFTCINQADSYAPSVLSAPSTTPCQAEGGVLPWLAKYCGYVIGSDDVETILASECYREEMKDPSEGCERILKLKLKICAHLIKNYQSYPSEKACLEDKAVAPLQVAE